MGFESGDEPVVSGEDGVSFGIPVVANLIAKMLLIKPTLTGAEVTSIITSNLDRTKMPKPIKILQAAANHA